MKMKKFLLLLIFFQFILIKVGYAEAATDEFSVINIKDRLTVIVQDNSQVNTDATVMEDGYINVPLIGTVYVKGRSVKDVEAEITKKLENGFIKYPVVSVKLSRGVERKIFLYGEVQRRGDLPFEEKLTALKALSLAGGRTTDGLYGKVKIRRKVKSGKNYENIEIDIEGILNDSQSEDILLQPDDVVIVERNQTFIVEGEVSRPAGYPLKKGMTVARALSEAGGITKDGLYGTVKVRRKNNFGEGYENIDIDIESILNDSRGKDILLQPDDVVIVERNKMFIVVGEVGKSGEFPLKKGMTVARALSEAGGITKDGLYGTVKVQRKNSLGEGYENIEIDSESILNESRGQDILLQPDDVVTVERNKMFIVVGEVSRPAEYPLKKGMTVARALSEAGGITKDGLYGTVKVRRKQKENQEYKDIDIALGRGLENNSSSDMLLKTDDVLIVERNDIFYIYGEVNKTGEYPLQKGLTAFTALSLAGGLTKWGSQDQINILRRSEEEKNAFTKIKVNIKDVIKGDASADVFLKPGDIVIVSSGIF